MKKIFFMMIATLSVCNIAVKAQTIGNNFLLTCTEVTSWKNCSEAEQKEMLTKVNEKTFRYNVILFGDSIIAIKLIKDIPFSKTTSKTGIWIYMINNAKVVKEWFDGDNPPTITRRTDGKLNAEGGNGDDDEYED